MSNLLINIRIFLYHIQLSNNWKLKISRNEYHKGYKNGYFEVYTFKPFK